MEDYDWNWYAVRGAQIVQHDEGTGTRAETYDPQIEIIEIARGDSSSGFVNMRTDRSFNREDGTPVRQLSLSLGLCSDQWQETDRAAFHEKEWLQFWNLCGRLIDEEGLVEALRSEVEDMLYKIDFEKEIEFNSSFQKDATTLVFSGERYQIGWILNWEFNKLENN